MNITVTFLGARNISCVPIRVFQTRVDILLDHHIFIYEIGKVPISKHLLFQDFMIPDENQWMCFLSKIFSLSHASFRSSASLSLAATDDSSLFELFIAFLSISVFPLPFSLTAALWFRWLFSAGANRTRPLPAPARLDLDVRWQYLFRIRKTVHRLEPNPLGRGASSTTTLIIARSSA